MPPAYTWNGDRRRHALQNFLSFPNSFARTSPTSAPHAGPLASRTSIAARRSPVQGLGWTTWLKDLGTSKWQGGWVYITGIQIFWSNSWDSSATHYRLCTATKWFSIKKKSTPPKRHQQCRRKNTNSKLFVGRDCQPSKLYLESITDTRTQVKNARRSLHMDKA